MKGVIKKKVTDKPFGFIGVDGQSDVFFHETSLVDVSFADLKEGDAVTFEVEKSVKDGQDRTSAVNVKLAVAEEKMAA